VLFLTVEVSFFLANLTKIAHGGWLPLLVAATVFTVLTTWQRGRTIVTRKRSEEEGSLRDFLDHLHELEPPIHRVAGTAVFLNATIDTTPLALRTNVEHNHVLQQRVIILNIEVDNIPHIAPADRLACLDVGLSQDGITHLQATFGFQDEPDVPATLELAGRQGLVPVADLQDVTYFLSRITLVKSSEHTMPGWRRRLFLTIAHNSANPVEYFGLPIDRSISMGAQIPV
jgi:KUP system potassium uptake protein